MRVLCVVGKSGSGKTSLIEQIVSHLSRDGARGGLVKHTHHHLNWHPPGKDSTRFWHLGVGSVVVADPHQLACFHRAAGSTRAVSAELRQRQEAGAEDGQAEAGSTTHELVAACQLFPNDVELVLAEGFWSASAPKVWLAVDTGHCESQSAPVGTRAIVVRGQFAQRKAREVVRLPVFLSDDVQGIAERVWDWAVSVDSLVAEWTDERVARAR